MSHSYPYRRSSDDFNSQTGSFTSSGRLHPRQQENFHSSRNTAAGSLGSYSEQTLSLLASCGLDRKDLSQLASMPHHMITVETLPSLLLEIKKKKSRIESSLRQASNSPKLRSSFQSNNEWGESWGDPRQSSNVQHKPASSNPSYVVDYNYGHPTENPTRRYESPACTTQVREKRGEQATCYWHQERNAGSRISPESSFGHRSSVRNMRGDYCREPLATSRPSDSYWSSQDANSCHQWTGPGPDPADSHIKRMSRVTPLYPPRKEADDFHGEMPQVFPYSCSLCEITVLSERDWLIHINGSQHADSQLRILQMYPEWDCRRDSTKALQTDNPRRRFQAGTQRSVERTDKSWSKGRQHTDRPVSESAQAEKTQESTRVICAKFAAAKLSGEDLIKLVKRFGNVENIDVSNNKAFIEMSSCFQANDVIKFFSRKNAVVNGVHVQLSLSFDFKFPQSSHVVNFSRLPPGKERNAELVAVAKRFGQVKHSLFLPSRVLVEMTEAEDAEKLVEHYRTIPLKLKGKIVQVSYSTEYSTLKHQISEDYDSKASAITTDKSHSSKSECGRRSPTHRRIESMSSKGRIERSSQSPDTEKSPSPHKENCSNSQTRYEYLEEGGGTGTIEKPPTRPEQDVSSHIVHPDEMTVNVTVSSASAEEKHPNMGEPNLISVMVEKSQKQVIGEVCKQDNYEEPMDLDSDIEGMEAFCDDEVLEENPQKEDQTLQSEPVVTMTECDKQPAADLEKKFSNQVVEEDLCVIETSAIPKKESCLQIPLEPLTGEQESASEQRREEQTASEEENTDFPEFLENCITLDELEDDDDEHEEKEHIFQQVISSGETFREENKVIYIGNLPNHFTDTEFLQLVMGFGKVVRYQLVLDHHEGFIEMEHAEDAQRVVSELSLRQVEMHRNLLLVQLSDNYLQPKTGWKPELYSNDGAGEKNEETIRNRKEEHAVKRSASESIDDHDEEPQAKLSCKQEEELNTTGVKPPEETKSPRQQEEENIVMESSAIIPVPDSLEKIRSAPESPAETSLSPQRPEGIIKPHPKSPENQEELDSDSLKPVFDSTKDPVIERNQDEQSPVLIGPYVPSCSVGREFVRPIVTYFCNLCNTLCESADEHCRSLTHYKKYKEHLQKNTLSKGSEAETCLQCDNSYRPTSQ